MGQIESRFDLNRDLGTEKIRFEVCEIRFDKYAIRFDSIWIFGDSIWKSNLKSPNSNVFCRLPGFPADAK